MTESNSRRNFLQKSALASLGLAVPGTLLNAQMPRSKMTPDFVVKNGRIRQSIMGWCFNNQFDKKDSKKNTMILAQHCKDIGLVAMEGISRDLYPDVKKMGLDISLVSGGHGFKNGPCNPKFHDEVVEGLKGAIDAAVEFDCPSVITFTGMRYDGMDDEEATKRCIDTWKEVIPYAEKHKKTLVLEHLNSRDDTHPMKGHPGYFGDDVDFCVDMIKEVGSENFKLLFDIYHVSVMNGDVIRRISEHKDYIAHYHTAGNPGRGELDDTQELNYPPIMKAILDTGYKGFVAQEFLPNWDDPVAALRHAAEVCDV
ncbi:MAG: TIM barrel protein [Verrucomicrobiales bacterium]